MKRITLLEKAKSHSARNKVAHISPEEVDLCLAWLRNDITTSQAAHALEVNQSNASQTIAARLKLAITQGLIAIIKTKPHAV